MKKTAKKMVKKECCCCGGQVRMIFPCSGGSDVGELTDQAARQLTKDGWGKMYCLAGVAAHLKGFLETTKSATEIVAIDGCPAACASKTLQHASFSPRTVNLKELGFLKGESPVHSRNVRRLCTLVKQLMEEKNG
ncbi:MAG: putative zinc-binding protein [Candidatus Omnitrophica bacterium]|nr:putative zinc-binding protein [Candidatus Omnitrophota bacterium]